MAFELADTLDTNYSDYTSTTWSSITDFNWNVFLLRESFTGDFLASSNFVLDSIGTNDFVEDSF